MLISRYSWHRQVKGVGEAKHKYIEEEPQPEPKVKKSSKSDHDAPSNSRYMTCLFTLSQDNTESVLSESSSCFQVFVVHLCCVQWERHQAALGAGTLGIAH